MGTWGAAVGISPQAWAGCSPHARTPALALHLQLGQSPRVPERSLHISGQGKSLRLRVKAQGRQALLTRFYFPLYKTQIMSAGELEKKRNAK